MYCTLFDQYCCKGMHEGLCPALSATLQLTGSLNVVTWSIFAFCCSGWFAFLR